LWIKEKLSTLPLGLVMMEKNTAPLDEECAQNLSAFCQQLKQDGASTIQSVFERKGKYGENRVRESETTLYFDREDSNQATLALDLKPIAGQTYEYKEITPTHGLVAGRFMSKSEKREVFTYFEVISARRKMNVGER